MQVLRIANIMIAIKILVVLVFCAFNGAQGSRGSKENMWSKDAEEIDWNRIAEKHWFLNVRTEQAPPRLSTVCATLGSPNVTSMNQLTVGYYLLINEVGIQTNERVTLRRQRPGIYTHARNPETLQAFGINSVCELEDLPEDGSKPRIFNSEFLIRTDYDTFILIAECNMSTDKTIGLIFNDEPKPSIGKLTAALNAWPVPSKSPLVVTPCEDLTIDLQTLFYPR